MTIRVDYISDPKTDKSPIHFLNIFKSLLFPLSTAYLEEGLPAFLTLATSSALISLATLPKFCRT